jgi:hypothetical protein
MPSFDALLEDLYFCQSIDLGFFAGQNAYFEGFGCPANRSLHGNNIIQRFSLAVYVYIIFMSSSPGYDMA